MKRKITLIVGTTALCVVLLTGCGDNASTAESKDEGVDSVRMQQETAESIGTASQESTDSTATKEEKQRNAELEESARKFKSAENYQASGEYFKAYSLYQKVIEDDAQNGYGATVRANFVVTFTFASKDTYSVALCTVS